MFHLWQCLRVAFSEMAYEIIPSILCILCFNNNTEETFSVSPQIIFTSVPTISALWYTLTSTSTAKSKDYTFGFIEHFIWRHFSCHRIRLLRQFWRTGGKGGGEGGYMSQQDRIKAKVRPSAFHHNKIHVKASKRLMPRKRFSANTSH